MSRKRILFIINPKSGIRKEEKSRLPQLIEQHLDKTLYDYSISYTEYAGHAIELSKEAAESGYHVVVSVGGDGSMNEIAGSLVGTDVILGIMPFGSGNGLARHLGIPINAKKALDVLNKFHAAKIDVGEYAPGKYFFSNVGIGFAVKVVKWFEHHKVRGFLSYAVAVMRGFTSNQTIKLTLEFNGKTLEREVTVLNICNSNQYGYGVGIAPNAKLDDGILDIAILNKFSRLLFPLYALCILFKKQHWIPHYELHTAATCKVLNEEKKFWVLQVDGELERFKEDWEVRALPLALHVLVP
ncbi:MAG: diacylglycerol kinase family lipid kinase [Chitinophagales bacterium]|nr:diacylglycerol kinase family lipid kinase [Chitinophagales bacterium]